MFARITTNRLVLAFSLYATLVFNLGFWRAVWAHSQSPTGTDWWLVLSMPVFVLALTNLVMQLLCWPSLHRVLVPAFLLMGAGIAYGVMVQGIYFNADMLQNVLQTDRAEASAWLSLKFGLWMLLTGVLPALLYGRYGRAPVLGRWYGRLGWRVAAVLASALAVGLVALMAYQHYAVFFRNNKGVAYKIVPINLVGASLKTAYNAYEAKRPFEPIAQDARRSAAPHARKRVMVLVVGETTRAQNWGLNPGAPDTTPELGRIAGVINYPDVSSCGTATAISVPCMFSNMTRADYNGNRARHREGVLDVLQRTGLHVSWRENDGGCKGVCDRVRHIDIRQLAKPGQCTSDYCLDMALLEGLEQEIEAMPGDGLIVLHGMGSHGPTYYQCYTPEFKRFSPTCDTTQLQDCDQQSLHNTYNNTIAYIDHMLAGTIALLNARAQTDAALLYVSDHGESLGEKGLYLHATPYLVAPREQTHVPMIFWANAGWYEGLGLSEACLRQRAGQSYSHDHLFHSLLGTFEVQTAEYQSALDMFAPCRTHG